MVLMGSSDAISIFVKKYMEDRFMSNTRGRFSGSLSSAAGLPQHHQLASG
jgi:hypothetical protein